MTRQQAVALAVVAAGAALAIGAVFSFIAQVRAPEVPPAGALPSSSVLASAQPSVAQAQAAADALLTLTLPDLSGREQAFAQWRGKILVANFWASWCAPCLEEMPAFSRLHQRYAAQGVQFIGIGLDDAEKMRAFVAMTPVSYPLLVADPLGSATHPGLQVRGLPYTLVIDRNGRLASSRLGRLDEAILEATLQGLLAGAGGPEPAARR